MPSLRARLNAVVKVFNSIFWGAIAAIICLAQLDHGVTGVFLKDFVANDILQLENEGLREKAAEIARYKIFRSGVLTSFCVAISIALFGIYFDIYDLFRKERAEQIQEDNAVSQLFYTHKIAQGQAQFHRDFKTQWDIQNEAASSSLKELVLTQDQMVLLREDMAELRKDLKSH